MLLSVRFEWSFKRSCDQMVILGFFFFSSRRRHTRFDCDWSSDVCSSDLDQDDLVTAAGATGFAPAESIRADQIVIGGARLPFLKFPRNPGGPWEPRGGGGAGRSAAGGGPPGGWGRPPRRARQVAPLRRRA